ncbi:DUF4123 domain-containing protein [Paraburkholderia sp. A1RI-2L]|uniref:DUF4123 domain-containing protein n=1 Tax=Paraburkholderia sp. A1RI-2L TaxID=3028367 RepID=UPI003B7C3D65
MEQTGIHGAGAQEGAIESPQAREAAAIERTVDMLRAYFSKHPAMRCILAVDPSQRDFAEMDGADAMAELPRTFVQIDHEAFPEAHRPYLVEMDLDTREGRALLDASVRLAFEDRRPASMAQGQGQCIGGWLASEATLDEVAAHWSGQALQYDEQGRACALRFYDARALSLIWPILTESQQQALLGPVKVWHALDACAKPHAYSGMGQSRRSLSIQRVQWPDVHRHGLINRALALHALANGRQPEPAEVDAAVAAAARAQQHGLHDREDQLAFIGHALEWHPQFDRHSRVADALQQMQPGDYYTAAIDALQPDAIEEIRRGAWYDTMKASSRIG